MEANGDPHTAECEQSPPPPPPELPKAPNPSSDLGVVPDILPLSLEQNADLPGIGDFDVGQMDAFVALKVLSRGVQALSDLTGDVPATPPATPMIKDLRDGASLRPHSISYRPATPPPTPVPSHDINSPAFKRIPIGSPEAHSNEPTVVGIEDAVSVRAQYEAIARKFYSRRSAPVTIDEYLIRLHRYCPMSTAVYLAAGVYILKLAVEERTVPVTPRTAHRLLLAALRVAMKALEDLSYPHERFAGVGGVRQSELAKLEISLCYLTEFSLKVDNEVLYEKAKELQQIASGRTRAITTTQQSKLAVLRDRTNRRQTVS